VVEEWRCVEALTRGILSLTDKCCGMGIVLISNKRIGCLWCFRQALWKKARNRSVGLSVEWVENTGVIPGCSCGDGRGETGVLGAGR
jgi:hypothetical protein